MPEPFVDVYLSEAELELLRAIETGPASLADLVEVASLSARGVAELLATESNYEKRALISILSGGDADSRAREWNAICEQLGRTAAEIRSAIAIAGKLVDDAVLGASGERLDRLLKDLDALALAQVVGFSLGLSWMTVARLADAPPAVTSYMATVLDATRDHVQDLQARIVVLRNANHDVARNCVLLDTKQVSDEDRANLVLTLTTAGSGGPANDVVAVERPASVGVGVFWGESLAVWLSDEYRSSDALATMDVVVAWVQRRHDEQMTKPRYLSFYSKLGFVLRTVNTTAGCRV